MKVRHYNIPIFIPEEACPNQCVFCDQRQISGVSTVPRPDEVPDIINQYLSTIDYKKNHVEVAFFGGSFTGLMKSDQRAYLSAVQPFISEGKVKSIRLSTRPDYIDEEILTMLKSFHVQCIELGAQSTNDEVLELSGRGHDAEAIFESARLIKSFDIELGLQMMIGLPGDTLERSIQTARDFISLSADNTRIYPTLVIKNTALAAMYEQGEYQPLTIEEATEWSAILLKMFEDSDVKVLRVGLHPSEDLEDGKGYIDGPFHASFKELVLTEIWRQELEKIKSGSQNEIFISVAPQQLNYAIGFKGGNRGLLLENFRKVKFLPDSTCTRYQYHVSHH
jgi:histone acetyltransferase (RNA polymerase elongator complex component)